MPFDALSPVTNVFAFYVENNVFRFYTLETDLYDCLYDSSTTTVRSGASNISKLR